MSSTNKTINLQLSQFLGTDKPAWLGDYNADMLKIDNAFAALSTGAASSTADIAALQQKDTQIDQDIQDTNDRIDSMADVDVALANKVTVLEGNYDTMHHEVAANQADITAMKPYAKVAADKEGFIQFRNTKNVGFDAYQDDAYFDITNQNDEIHRIASYLGSAVSGIILARLNSDGSNIRDNTEFAINTGCSIHFEQLSYEVIAIHFKGRDREKYTSLVFSKTNGITMQINDHGSVTELFNIPVPTPSTPTI